MIQIERERRRKKKLENLEDQIKFTGETQNCF